MENVSGYAKAYTDLLSSGAIENSILSGHIQRYSDVDAVAPTKASFFYLIQPTTGTYHFLGKQQEAISGVSNDEFIKGGISSFLKRVHPEDLKLVVNEIYVDFSSWFLKRDPSTGKENVIFQYNYRFLNADDEYCNLMEQVYILEVDSDDKPSLLLGNVILLGCSERLAIRSSLNLYRDGMIKVLKSKSYSDVGSYYNLTKRELDILKNLAFGKSSKEISAQLYISPHTVDTHRRTLLKKLGCTSVVQLAKIAYTSGLV